MADDFYDDYGEPSNRKAAVARHLARLKTAAPAESPEVIERQKRETAERLAKQDLLFNNYPGASISDLYKLPKNVSVGDPYEDALDDADRELASYDDLRR